ncbi:MAG: hypothetical protein SF053_02860 [Bacteroidia bacterium]|nr:hypothetical protein [Bacteroidia bacterium]
MRRLRSLLVLLCLLAPLRAQVDSLYDSSITLRAACRTAPTLARGRRQLSSGLCPSTTSNQTPYMSLREQHPP